MCQNLRYESVYFKELHKEQEYYWPTIYRTGAAVVSTITSRYICDDIHAIMQGNWALFEILLHFSGFQQSDETIT